MRSVGNLKSIFIPGLDVGSGVVVFAGDSAGAVVEDGTLISTGALSIVDGSGASFVAQSSAASNAGYGSVDLDTAGNWTYTLDNAHATVQALSDGETLADSFTAATTHSKSRLVSVTITGADDAPVFGGDAAGAVTEDAAGTLVVSGTLTITDTDDGEDAIQPDNITGTYGSFTIDAAGAWSYSADNSQTAIQSLDTGETLADVFAVYSIDGTAQNITITINGTEDSSVITGTITGSVTEDGALTANGSLSITDVDTSDNPVSFPDVASTAGDNGYGDFEMTSGAWTYTLDNANATVQALDVAETLTDTHTFTASDSSTQVVTITINGAYDEPSGFDPSDLFQASEQGAWYDPSDLSTLFQDDAGTTPVTADGDPVGLMLDKSQGGVSAVELISNGDFSNGTTDWSVGSSTVVDGELVVTSLYNDPIQQNDVVEQGKTYLVEFSITDKQSTTPTARVLLGTVEVFSFTPNVGSYSYIVESTTADARFRMLNKAGSPAFTIDNISVKEIPGNHATQSTTSKRPTYKTDGTLHWLDFDGVDDYLFIPATIPATTMSTFAAIDTTTTSFCYRSNSGGGNAFNLIAANGSSSNPYGSEMQVTPASTRANGSAVAMTTRDQVHTAITGAPVVFGLIGQQYGTDYSDSQQTLFIYGGATFIMAGKVFGMIDRYAAMSAQDIDDVESYLAEKSGVTL